MFSRHRVPPGDNGASPPPTEPSLEEALDVLDIVYFHITFPPPRIDFISPTAGRLYGPRSVEPGPLEQIIERVHPEDVGVLLDGFASAIARREPLFRATARALRADGSYRWTDVLVKLLYGADGGEGLCFAIGAEQRLDAERSLLEMNARLGFLLSSSRTGMYTMSVEDLSPTWVSPNSRLIVGYDPEIFIDNAHFWLDQVHPEDRAALAQGFSAIASTRSFDGRFRFRHSSGRYIWLTVTNQLVAGGEHGAVIIGSFQDSSTFVKEEHERERHERRHLARERLEVLGRLAGGIAHDFNNLLAVITNLSDLALNSQDADDVKRDVHRILDAAVRGSQMTRQLLEFGSGQAASLQPVDVNPEIEETVQLARVGVDQAIQIEFHPDGSNPRTKMVPGGLHRIVSNLISNAVGAITGQGTVTVRTNIVSLTEHPELGSGDFVQIQVSDTGAGMSEEVSRKACEPYFTTKSFDTGTGLGLTTVHALVVRAGGTLQIDSAVSEGTAVTVLLPLVSEESRGRAVGIGRTVIVVDEFREAREATARILERAGFRVMVAKGAEEVIRLVRAMQSPPDAVLTNRMMPGLDGIRLAADIDAQTPGLPVMMISAYGRPEGWPDAAIIEKPSQAADLIKTLAAAIEEARRG